MCMSICCDVLYKTRCCFWKLLPILWLVDLALTVYLVYALYQSDIFACCTTNEDPVGAFCGYDDLGGAANVAVNDYGFCVREDDGTVCNQMINCAYTNIPTFNTTVTADPEGAVYGEALCNQTVLEEVAFFNFFWLNGVMIVKACGLVFLLLLELRACINKIQPDEQEAQQTETCFKCRQWGKQCCISSFVLVLKGMFIIFGTFATFAAIYYMELAGHVLPSRCDAISDDATEQLCDLTSDTCNSTENFYAVVFDSLDLKGPYWFDVVSNVLHTVLWVIRIAVMRYALKSTHLADV